MAARTPLYDRHVAMGARMVEFAGFDMPLQYSSIREEHEAVRNRAGIFDLSHMGEVRIAGADADATVQRLISNDLNRVSAGGAVYSVMCNEHGGIVDDVVVYRDDDSCMVVVNASCRQKDVSWMRDHAAAAGIEDISDDVALIAVQGPRARAIVATLTSVDLDSIKPFHATFGDVAGVASRISRTGYTGEDGLELYVMGDVAMQLWDALLEVGEAEGLVPCGLGARDTLRLEAGLRLYGQDMDDGTDPYSCALGWTVKLDKGEFIGAGALRAIDPKHPPRRFIGLRLAGRTIARHSQPVLAGDLVVGEVTSGTYSFTLGHGIATASVQPSVTPTTPLFVDIRGTVHAAEQVPLPFYRRPKGG
ncbi:MAG: glycine cleavage system aminomethyltransferase GcvT [Candidatus Dormibacteraeota bacterium]|nr:glycine cleavage system aminomethyltransferase GcvT [Candidatus Dormibacteraeota bacterium]MBV9524353.1 glycine cleavage system aminomethyltransferase GcvT [Candidatus Dormibacteraeota bacterium]